MGVADFTRTAPHSNALVRSGDVVARGVVLNIDSTVGDHRSFEMLFEQLTLDRSIIYIGVDGATKEGMAIAMGFGEASRFGLGILLRNYVRRHGFLPHCMRIDQGSEYIGEWLEELCSLYTIDLHWNATANSRSSSDAENLHNCSRTAVLIHLPGSTEPDKAGRSVSNQYKSYKTAWLAFKTVREQVENYVSEDVAKTPLSDGKSPVDHANGAKGAFQLGIP